MKKSKRQCHCAWFLIFHYNMNLKEQKLCLPQNVTEGQRCWLLNFLFLQDTRISIYST